MKTKIFSYFYNGEKLFCCVRKSDYLKYGEECFLKKKIPKGISDDYYESLRDYKINLHLFLSLGFEADENSVH